MLFFLLTFSGFQVKKYMLCLSEFSHISNIYKPSSSNLSGQKIKNNNNNLKRKKFLRQNKIFFEK